MAPHKLILNAVPIDLPEAQVTIGHLPYDKDVLERLRRQQAGELLAQRHEDVIETIPLVAEAAVPGTPHEVDLSSRPSLVAALARESLIRFLGNDKHYPVLSRRPLRVIGEKASNLVAASYGLPEWLEKRLVLRFDTRVLHRKGETPRLVLVCDAGTRNTISVPCSELHRIGISLVGRYVTVLEAAFDPRLEDYRRIVGRVVAVENGVLRLEDHTEGYPSVRAEDAWLEPRRDNWNLCVTSLLGGKAEKVIEDVDDDIARVRQGDRRLDLICRTLHS